MADWHKITKRIDSSAPIDRDFQPRVLNRDIENSILEPQSDLTTLDLEHNSVKHDISPLYRFENYYRSSNQNMNYHQSTNNQSSRRHSVSNPQTKERTYISKSQNQGTTLGPQNWEGKSTAMPVLPPFNKINDPYYYLQ